MRELRRTMCSYVRCLTKSVRKTILLTENYYDETKIRSRRQSFPGSARKEFSTAKADESSFQMKGRCRG